MGKTLSKYPILQSYNLTNRKGIYPYDYISGNNFSEVHEKMKETCIPAHEHFYSQLKQENIMKEDYELAQQNWTDLGCNILCDYTMAYLKIDVLLLADVFENFRNICLEYYEIDPCYTYSAPGLTWLAGLKYTKVNLKYYKENTYDQLLMIDKGIRGGVSSCLGDRYVKTYNKHVDEDYNVLKQINQDECNKLLEDLKTDPLALVDALETENYVEYLDFNSLYPTCMVQDLPTGEMKELRNLTYSKSTAKYGFIYEVDLHYPDELKDKTHKFPFCPENTTANVDEFSDYQH